MSLPNPEPSRMRDEQFGQPKAEGVEISVSANCNRQIMVRARCAKHTYQTASNAAEPAYVHQDP